MEGAFVWCFPRGNIPWSWSNGEPVRLVRRFLILLIIEGVWAKKQVNTQSSNVKVQNGTFEPRIQLPMIVNIGASQKVRDIGGVSFNLLIDEVELRLV